MAMNIKNPLAEKLARRVAAVSGESMTRAVIVALEERLERLEGRKRAPDLYEEIMLIAHRCQSQPDIDSRSADEIIGYDEYGSFGHDH